MRPEPATARPPARTIGIQALLLRVFLPVVALAALLLAVLVYQRINATILGEFDDRLATTSALTGAFIDPADHDWLIREALAGEARAAAAETDDRYRRNVDPMRRIRERLGLTYIYTQVADGDRDVRYILDGTDGEEHTPLGSPDTLPAETMAGLRDVQAHGSVYVSPVEYQEQWGLLKTAAAPVYGADGRISGTAGADVNVSVLRVATQQALFLSAMIGIASLLACLLVTLQIVRGVARPIARLTQESLRIAAGDHRPPARIASPREVRRLAAQLAHLNDHVTGELDAAASRAAAHRLTASADRLLAAAAPAGTGVVVLADDGDRRRIWLAADDGGVAASLRERVMTGLAARLAGHPYLAASLDRLAAPAGGALLTVDRGARTLALTGTEPVVLDGDAGPLPLAPGAAVAWPAGSGVLRYRGVAIVDLGGRAR